MLTRRYSSHDASSPMVTENKHLREMLMAHLDIIQQQSETILSKDRMLKALRDETVLLRQKLSRMTRRLKPGEEAGEAGGREEGGKGKKRSLLPAPCPPAKRRLGEAVSEGGGGEGGEVSTPRVERRAAECRVENVDELRDEFCQQTSPELPRAERRSLEEERREGRRSLEERREAKREARRSQEEEEARGVRRSLEEVESRLPEISLEPEPPKKGSGGRGRKSRAADPSPQPPGASQGPSPLTSAALYYVGCRNDRQVNK